MTDDNDARPLEPAEMTAEELFDRLQINPEQADYRALADYHQQVTARAREQALFELGTVQAAFEDKVDECEALREALESVPPYSGMGVCRYCGEQVRLWMHPTGWEEHPHADTCKWDSALRSPASSATGREDGHD